MKRPRLVIVPIGPSIAYVPLTRNLYALIDSWNAERIGKWNWYAGLDPQTGKFYAKRQQSRGGRKTISMHGEVLSLAQGMEGDHIHGTTLDNRESQLRAATHLQNSYNKPMRSHNTSGFKGVHWNKTDKIYVSRIRVDGEAVSVWRGHDPAIGHLAYCEAAKRLHGEFARTA